MSEGEQERKEVPLEDGGEVLEYLMGLGDFDDRTRFPLPSILFLDWRMPKKDGREVLKGIKENAALKSIPVVILTTSAYREDVLESYRLHANCYITKPVDLEGFLTVVRSIDKFWLSIVKLPRERGS